MGVIPLLARSRLSVVVVVAFVACTMVTAVALAHYTEIVQGHDKAWVSSSHDHLNILDNECDGNYTWAEGWDNSQYGFHRVRDGDGCAGGGRHADGYNFYSYRICEDVTGTSYRCSNRRTP